MGLKKLAGDTVLYGLGSIVPRFLNFLLVPLHTAVFLPDDYGVITKLLAYVGVVNTIYMFGMETAYFRFATKDPANEKRIFNLAQTVVIAISLTLSIFLALWSESVATLINLPGRGNLIIWLVAIMFMDALVAIPFARLRLQKKALLFVTGKLINIGILVALNIYFLKFAYVPERGVDFVFIATLTANAFYVLFFIRTLLQWRPAFDNEISPVIFKYGYPVMLTGLAGMTSEMFSRITLDEWLPANFYPGKSRGYVTGIFGACAKFSILMNLAIQAFRYAAEPFFFSNAADKNSPQLFARINHYFIITCCFLLLGVSINIDVLKYFLANEQYWQGLNIVPVLLLGYLFLGVYYNLTVWFKLTDKTYYGTIITVIGAVVTIVLNYVLIPHYGIMGSSLATLACYGLMMVLCYFFGQKFYPIPYNVGGGLVYIFTTMMLVYIVQLFTFSNQWLATGFHGAVILVYIILIFLIERKSFRQVVR